MRFSRKTQSSVVALIAILAASIALEGCITDSSTELDSASGHLYSPLELTDNSLGPVLNNSTFFVLAFYYPGCGPCKYMNNITLELSNELRGQVKFGRMNVWNKNNNQTVKKYRISTYPTLLLFDKGILVSRMSGNIGKSDLLFELKEYYPDLDTSSVNLMQSSAIAKAQAAVIHRLTPVQACANMTKSDSPLLEAFVVSQCPFGLQMQRIMAEIVHNAPEAEDYLKVRYIGSVSNNIITSMHGDKEAQENLRQICIREEQPAKYWDYINDYIKQGDSIECLKSSAIDKSKLNACIKDSSRGLAYAQNDFDRANEFDINGSPTLIMGNKVVSESNFATNTTNARSPEALKQLLCCGFGEEPSFCNLQLNKTRAITMFDVKAQTAAKDSADQHNSGRDIALIEPRTKNPSQVMSITDDNMDLAVSRYPLFVAIGFTDWCGYCKRFNVTLSELASELQGQVAFGLIDMDHNNETKTKYNITAYPTSLIFKDGKLIDRLKGNEQKSIVIAALKKTEPNLNTSKVKIVQAKATPRGPKLAPVQICANMTKSDKPLLQAFVVSRCPFGLQMQRIMAYVIDQSDETEKYLKVMYIGSVDTNNNTITSMHGEEEAQENLRQICIREEQPAKYWNYLRCYMKEGKSAECQRSVSLDIKMLDSCTNESSRGLAYAQKDFDLADRFEITGSPTMLMNNEIVKEFDFATNKTNGRSPEALKELLCCGFINEPSFCSMHMNTSRMATMFSAK